MRLQRTHSNLGHGVRVYPNEPDSFFDGWLKHGASVLGINGNIIRYVVSDGDVYYNLDDVFEKIHSFGPGILSDIHSFCFGISGDQIKDLAKMFPQEANKDG